MEPTPQSNYVSCPESRKLFMKVLEFEPKSGWLQKPMSFHSVLLSPHMTLKSVWLQAYAATSSCSSWWYAFFFSCLINRVFIFNLMPLKFMKCQLSTKCILSSFRPIESNVRDTMVFVFIHLTKMFLVRTPLPWFQGMIGNIGKEIMGAPQKCWVSYCDYLMELVLVFFQHSLERRCFLEWKEVGQFWESVSQGLGPVRLGWYHGMTNSLPREELSRDSWVRYAAEILKEGRKGSSGGVRVISLY